MLKIEHFVLPSPQQWQIIIEGMRNPLNSWARSDSAVKPVYIDDQFDGVDFTLGENDHQLMMKLASGGAVHAKYRRMIPVFITINAPLYWWKEFDTYKIGTVVNSCSTMHKIHSKEFTLDDFSHEHLLGINDFSFTLKFETDLEPFRSSAMGCLEITVGILNGFRNKYLETNDKKYWWQMIQLLPTSYNQKRTVLLNYEVLVNIFKWRKDHKLDEWHVFCDWIRELPYSEIITGCP